MRMCNGIVGSQMTEAERLRQRADRALRLARGSPADNLNLMLRIAAADYLRRAVELERRSNQLAPHHAQQQQQIQPDDKHE
jgi:hypothetical protein